ncbi:MAG: protein kinase [Clostridiales bacterium]|nr:protein kinase [Clostridiales bacterium]
MEQIVTWPGWETVRLIGRGSFGAVYEIQRTLFGEVEKAALKVVTIPQNASDIEELRSDGFDEESITDSFKNHLKSIVSEYTLMRKMNGCTNIVNCDDVRYVQHEDGIGWDIYIKMELLTPLAKTLPDEISEDTVIKIATDLCSALELCEKFGIIHRDIKPQNIFVSDNGDYKLGDFGIAKTAEKTMSGTKIGTYKYMAPEVYNNRPYGSAADLYSLGLVLYWLLNERRMPFLPLPPAKLSAGMDEAARARRLAGEPIPAPKNGSEGLKQIILKACAYDPKERYPDAKKMKEALNKLRTAVPEEQEEQEEQDEDATVVNYRSSAKGCARTDMPGGSVPATEVEKPVQPSPDLGSVPEAKPSSTSQKRKNITEPKSKDSGAAVSPPPQKRKKHKPVKILPIACLVTLIMILSLVTVGWFNCWFGHQWSEATCTSPQICQRCGTQSDKIAEHQWSEATCTSPPTCQICGAQDGEVLGHQWSEATCISPQTCQRCGAQKGEASGHQWSEATCTSPQTCQVCGTQRGEVLEHQWTGATCSSPQTCQVCGAQNGEILGHQWSEATCTTAQICQRCGAQNGEALGHQWNKATCAAAQTCQRCGAQEGTALAHRWSEATCTTAQTCQLCGATMGKPLPHSWADANQNSTYCKVCGIKKNKMMPSENLGYMSLDKRKDAFLWGQSTFRRSDVTSIVFSGAIDKAPASAWDVSASRDKSVLAWLDKGRLTIASDGIIGAHPNSSWLFAEFRNVTSIDFSDRFDTSTVSNMNAMFSGCSAVRELDLSAFRTSKVSDMGGMFNNCNELVSVDVSSFDTSNVRHMQWMFGQNSKLKSLDISNFDTSRVMEDGFIFYYCSQLSSVTLPKNMSRIGASAFEGCANLKEVTISRSCAVQDGTFPKGCTVKYY